jgi:hypothetical protein
MTKRSRIRWMSSQSTVNAQMRFLFRKKKVCARVEHEWICIVRVSLQRFQNNNPCQKFACLFRPPSFCFRTLRACVSASFWMSQKSSQFLRSAAQGLHLFNSFCRRFGADKARRVWAVCVCRGSATGWGRQQM